MPGHETRSCAGRSKVVLIADGALLPAIVGIGRQDLVFQR